MRTPSPPSLSLSLSVAVAVLLTTACETSFPVGVEPGESALRVTAAPGEGLSSRGLPWREMSDAELAVAVEAAGGLVFIGIKDPQARAGVDEYGRVLVRTTDVGLAKASLREEGIQIEMEFQTEPAVVARIPSDLVAALRSDPLIDYVEPIFPMERLSQTVPWNITRVRAPEAWPVTTGSGAKLLIIDSGVRNDHPDLGPAVIQSCVGDDGLDTHGHGTAVAGIAAALNNSIQIVGVAPGVLLWSSKDGDRPNAADPGGMACAVEFGIVNNVQVINISSGLDAAYSTVTNLINRAYYETDIVVVAAAGNDNGPVKWPARLESVIAVAATDQNNARAWWSARGPEIELAAPGTTDANHGLGLVSTCLNGSTCAALDGKVLQGTSYAAAHVSGVAALLRSYDPSWKAWQVRGRLQLGALDLPPAGRNHQFGYGLVDVIGALNAPDPVPPPLVVSVTGTDQIGPYISCSWYASAQGGIPPYTYSWSVNLQPVGGNSVQLTYTNQGGISFAIDLAVTDGYGQIAYGMHYVAVTPGHECT
jgi:subtilisin